MPKLKNMKEEPIWIEINNGEHTIEIYKNSIVFNDGKREESFEYSWGELFDTMKMDWR